MNKKGPLGWIVLTLCVAACGSLHAAGGAGSLFADHVGLASMGEPGGLLALDDQGIASHRSFSFFVGGLVVLIGLMVVVVLVWSRSLRHRAKTATLQLRQELEQREAAQEELRKRDEIVRATLESSIDGVLVINDEGYVSHWNKKFQEIWSIPDDVLFVKKDEKLIEHVLPQLADPDGFLDKVSKIYETSMESEDHIELKDGRVLARFTAPLKKNTEESGRVWFFRDITEKLESQKRSRELEDKLRQSQKLEAVGQLAGGVAHDFNNLLTAIIGNAQLLELRHGKQPEDEDKALIHDIMQAATRASDLTRQLLAFSRKGQINVADVDLHMIIGEVVRLLARSIDRRIEIVQNLQAEFSVVHGDPGQLQSTILNLGLNARDAMPQGGQLTIATANVDMDEAMCKLHSFQIQPGRFIQIKVSDTGVGMSEETQKRVFEPFYTTKGPGEGTGLGLAAVYGAVRTHDGAIQITSQIGQGTMFEVLLPVTQKKNGTPSERPAREEMVKGKGHVLVIDDERIVRDLAAKALRTMGYTVNVCSDGIEGVDFFRRHHEQIDAVILDMIMPKQSGEDTFAMLREIDTRQPILIASGYSESQASDRLMQQGAAGFLAKPFRINELSAKIAQAMQGDQ